MKKQSVLIHTISDRKSAEAVIKILANDPEFTELTLPEPIFDKLRQTIRHSINWETNAWYDTMYYKIIGKRRPGKRTQYKPLSRKIKVTKELSYYWVKQA